jgi:hypothetical protein
MPELPLQSGKEGVWPLTVKATFKVRFTVSALYQHTATATAVRLKNASADHAGFRFNSKLKIRPS